MKKLALFSGLKLSLLASLTQWYFLYRIKKEKRNLFILLLCKCIIPKRKKLLDENVKSDEGFSCSLDTKTIEELGIAKDLLKGWLINPNFDEKFLTIMPELLNLISTNEKELNELGDRMFYLSQQQERLFCNSYFAHLMMQFAVIIYQRTNCKEGIEKCADWFWSHDDSYPHDLFYKTNLYIEVGAFDKIKKQLNDAKSRWSGEGAYSVYVNFYEELIKDLQWKQSFQSGCDVVR